MRAYSPFLKVPTDCLNFCQLPRNSYVFALDPDIVIKMPFEFRIPETLDSDAKHWLDEAIRGFCAREKEEAVYDAVASRPHINFARRLEVDPSINPTKCVFVERLQPLEDAWAYADAQTHYRWVRELLSAISWLEELGWCHGQLEIGKIGIDSANRLKLFGFTSVARNDTIQYAMMAKADHSGLATCLHYLLDGVDPFSSVRGYHDIKELQRALLEGRGKIGAGAEILRDVIQAGWTGEAATTKFSDVKERVEVILGAADPETASGTLSVLSDEHYFCLEERCAEWLEGAPLDPKWMNLDEYYAVAKAKGLELDLDVWRTL